VRYIGASAYASWQLAHANVLAELRGWTPFVALQSEYSLLNRSVEREVLPYCRAHRVGFVPYYPLAGGFLTGKYEKGRAAPVGSRGERDRYVQRWMTERNYIIIKNLVTWVESRGRKINELAQGWLLAAVAGLLGDHRRDDSVTCFEQRRWSELGSYGGRIRRSDRHFKGRPTGFSVKTLRETVMCPVILDTERRHHKGD